MVLWAHLSPQPKRHLDRFRRFCRAHYCGRRSDRRRYSVCNNRPRLRYEITSLSPYVHWVDCTVIQAQRQLGNPAFACQISLKTFCHRRRHHRSVCPKKLTRMWANAQRDGRPAEYRWRPLFNAAKFS